MGIDDPRALSEAGHEVIRRRCAKADMALYRLIHRARCYDRVAGTGVFQESWDSPLTGRGTGFKVQT